MKPANTYSRFGPWGLLVVACLLAWLAYAPGLHGTFLFDDFVNLDALGDMGPINDWPSFARYVTSGVADPTGRPIALLSFMLDARDWPADPAPFLRTNVVLHLFNGLLLFCLLRVLGRRVDGTGMRTDAAALLGMAAWLLHPLLVSTTLYIVQREAMLAATFVLLGLLAWLHGNAMLARSPRGAMAWMVSGIVGGTLLAVLCKANGALLPLLALVLRATVATPPAGAAQANVRLADAILAVPSLALVAYLVGQLHELDAVADGRRWTLGERLLTEPRVLFEYLRLLVVPQALSTGLYNDAYPISTGLLNPLVTLPALLAVVAVPLAAFLLRRRAPALAAAVLFFFAGHLLEGSTIALELYFEHRNYLPAVLLAWPLARALCRWRVPLTLRVALALAGVGLLAAITWQRTTLWGEPNRMAAVWVLQNPNSSRAQSTAASYELAAGHPARARARLAGPWRARPLDLQLSLNYVNAACASGGLSRADALAVARALRGATEGDQLLHRWLGRALDVASNRSCPGLDLVVVGQWLAAARANPHLASLSGRRQDLLSLSGRLALRQGQADLALREFDAAFDQSPKPQVALMQAAMLASADYEDEALRHLDRAARTPAAPAPHGWTMQRVHAWVLARQQYWPREIASLRAKIEDERAQRHSRSAPGARQPGSGN